VCFFENCVGNFLAFGMTDSMCKILGHRATTFNAQGKTLLVCSTPALDPTRQLVVRPLARRHRIQQHAFSITQITPASLTPSACYFISLDAYPHALPAAANADTAQVGEDNQHKCALHSDLHPDSACT
jgi:hypothetical protein